MNLLVIDSNRLLNRFLTTYLRGKGHQASSLDDGSKALITLDAANPKFDAVIVSAEDVGPFKGKATMATIRQSYPSLTIVAFGGIGYEEEAMQEARKAGANGFVSKGLGPSEIYRALFQVLQEAAVPAKE